MAIWVARVGFVVLVMLWCAAARRSATTETPYDWARIRSQYLILAAVCAGVTAASALAWGARPETFMYAAGCALSLYGALPAHLNAVRDPASADAD